MRITPHTLLPDLFREFPESRAVFNRHGLRGCGGARGPAESIGFFAHAHGVDASRLLEEIRSVASDPEQRRQARRELEAEGKPRFEDAVYRPFFLAGLVIVLTVGAGWGALLLAKIGLGGSFREISVHESNAHGQAQIMGWVALFIMGFAYQAFPRMWRTYLPAPRLAAAVWLAMLGSIALRSAAMAMHQAPWAVAAHTIGSVVQVGAVSAFAGQLARAWRTSGQRLSPSAALIFIAIGCMVIQTVFSGWHMHRLITAPGREALLYQIATYQGPLRDVQIHGMAMLMIFGVGLRMFPALFGFAEPSQRRAWWSVGLLAGALIAETGLFLVFQWTGERALASGLMLPWLALPVGAWLLIGAWKPWRRPSGRQGGRSLKFVRASLTWLFIAFAMTLTTPGYLALYEGGFSHAYHGAIRHAITVGFISLMIMGMAAKVVPTLNGVDPRGLSRLWGPSLLVNTGCLMRVSLQIATDWTGAAYPLIGLSGALELAGLAWWAGGLSGVMWRGREAAMTAETLPAPTRLAVHHTVGQTVHWFPETIETLANMGLTPIRNPMLRRTVARRVTLAQAAAMGGVPLADLLAALNETIGAADQEQVEPTASRSACPTCASEATAG